MPRDPGMAAPARPAIASGVPTVALSLVAIACAYAAAAAAAAGRRAPTMLALVAAAVAAVWRWPMFAFAAVLIGGATVTSSRALPFSIGPAQTDVVELLVLATVALHSVRPALLGKRPPPHVRVTGQVVLLFVAAATLGAAHGLFVGADRYKVQGVLKSYFVLLIALPMLRLCATPAGRARLARLVIAVSTGGAAYVLLAQVIGLPVVSESPTQLNTLGQEPGVSRVRPLLISLLVVAVLLVQAQVHREGASFSRVGQIAAFWTVIGLSFNRTSWLPLLLASVVLWVAHRERRDLHASLASLVVLAAVLAGTTALASSGHLGKTAAAVADRVASTGDSRLKAENSYLDRSAEATQAVHAVTESPILGIGVGNTYGYALRVYDPKFGVYRLQQRDFTHNSLLLLYLHTGLAGMLLVVALVVHVTRLAIRARREGSAEASTVLAAALALLALALAALAEPYLYYRPFLISVAVALVLLHSNPEQSPGE